MQNCSHYSYYKEVSIVQEYTSLVMEHINNVVGIKLSMFIGIGASLLTVVMHKYKNRL